MTYVERKAEEFIAHLEKSTALTRWTNTAALIASVIEDCAREAEAAAKSIVERRDRPGFDNDERLFQYASGMLAAAHEVMGRIRKLARP